MAKRVDAHRDRSTLSLHTGRRDAMNSRREPARTVAHARLDIGEHYGQAVSAPPDDVARSPALMREINARRVFQVVSGADAALSLTQIVADTGLSKPTVSLALAHLERRGVIRVVGTRTGQAGPSPRLFALRPEAAGVVVVDIGRRWVSGVAADLSGTITARVRERSQRSVGGLVAQIDRMVQQVLDETGHDVERVASVVVAIPGSYDRLTGRVRHASNLLGLQNPALVPALRERFGPHLAFENDIDLAALGEQAYGEGRGVDDFVVVSIGTGLGLGMVLGGRLHRGSHGTAGELAYVPPINSPDRAQPVSAAVRRRGALESQVAADGWIQAAGRHQVPGPATPRAVLAAARRGDPSALAAIDEVLDALAGGLAAVIALVDPALVVVGGGIGRQLAGHLDAVQAKVGELLPLAQPRFAISDLGDDATLFGGLASGLTTARERVLLPSWTTDRGSGRIGVPDLE